MMSRIIKSEEVRLRLGWSAVSERPQAKWKVVSSLSCYEARGPHGEALTGVTCAGPDGAAVLYLTPVARLELIKGLLMGELDHPISMTADDEAEQILRQALAAIEIEKKAARQLVESIRNPVG